LIPRDDDFDRINLKGLRSAYPGVFDKAQFVGVGTGWRATIHEFLEAAMPLGAFEVLELKEKFGALRIWLLIDGLDQVAEHDIRLLQMLCEERARHRCEICGQAAHIRTPPPDNPQFAWWRCRCDQHATEEQRNWPVPSRPNYRQLEGQFNIYDPVADVMTPTETPDRWKKDRI
jgi:hypothetical protein